MSWQARSFLIVVACAVAETVVFTPEVLSTRRTVASFASVYWT